MTPLLICLIGAALAGSAIIGSQAAAGRIAAALLLAGVGGGLWWTGTQAGAGPVQVEARSPAGAPVTAQVLVKSTQGRRDALAVPFERTVPAGTPLLLMLALGLVGAAGARKAPVSLGATAGAAAMAGWAASLFASAGGRLTGEQAARDQIAAALPNLEVLQFTVPPAWVFDTQGMLIASAGAAGLGLLWIGLGGRLGARGRGAVAIGAAIAAAGCAWQAVSVGGFPWRGAEGAMAAVAIGTGVVWMLRRRPLLASAVAGLSLAAGLVGLI